MTDDSSLISQPAEPLSQSPDLTPVSACWRETGVYGNNTCPKLHEFVHCRNCTVYWSAGVRLLETPMPPDYRAQWAEHFATKRKVPEPVSLSVIPFRVQSQWLALPTYIFQEVSERRPIHSLPHRRQGPLIGVANVRGELLVCVSLGHLLGLPGLPPRETLRQRHQRLLVLNSEDGRLALPVDEVSGPERLDSQELRPPPNGPSRSFHAFAQHIFYCNEHPVGLLDAERLLKTLGRSFA
ncbi:MAG TPA: chemotaxis protein CheW [Verrucomicrobiae bacterium]|nr:chemotaxis protein CheW [Verrucomicrobiae bacterium]